MSNTINKHIYKLQRSIDNKLFDLLVDIEDQIATGNYEHWKINHELRQVIMRKILLDKGIKITPNKLGVYGYSHNTKIQYKEYQLTLGKGADNLIYPMYALITYNDKCITKRFDYNSNDIKKKIQYNLVNVFKNQKKDFECIHNNIVELNNKYYRYNNIKFVYPNSDINIYNNKLNLSVRNSNISNNILHSDDEIMLQDQIHHNPQFNRNSNKNNDNELILQDNKIKNSDNSNEIKYKFNHIEDDYMFDIDSDEADDIDNVNYKNMLKQIKFYEDAMGLVSNSHKNKDRVKYLESLKKKFYKKQQQNEQFQKYYEYSKKIDMNDF
jgi:hypothetical protein